MSRLPRSISAQLPMHFGGYGARVVLRERAGSPSIYLNWIEDGRRVLRSLGHAYLDRAVEQARALVREREAAIKVDEIVKLWSHIDRSGPDCWEWQGAVHPDGYGLVRLFGALDYVHRHVYRLAYGIEPTAEDVVRHRCDNPPCARPSHLLLGTQADNIADMIERGRAAWQGAVQ